MLPATVAEQTRSTLVAYLKTTFGFRNQALEKALFEFLLDPGHGLFRGPFLDLRLPFRQASDATIPLDIAPSFTPFAHQLKAFERLSQANDRTPQSTLITTGTGSGKTECFLFPVLDHCWRRRGEPGIKAIFLYPMNALATDQAGRIAKLLASDPRLSEVSAGLYVGGKGEHSISTEQHLVDKREVLRNSPPDILLTNYRMLDYLLLRPADNPLWKHNDPQTLRYLVLDELHTYDGAQGSDVACLIRRLKDRLGTPAGHLVCVGTSATIGSAGTREPRQLLAEFASQVFGETIPEDAIVGEDRLTVAEAFPREATLQTDPFAVVSRDPSVLDPANHASYEAFVAEQKKLWFPQPPADAIALGAALEEHGFLRDLLRAIDGKDGSGSPRDWQSVAEHLARTDDAFATLPRDTQWLVLASFLALVAEARRLVNGQERPFLPLQVQLWVRELRGLLRKVADKEFAFAWRDELREAEGNHWLPMVYCHECGLDGLGALAIEGRDRLSDASNRVGEAYLRRTEYARFVELHGRIDGELPRSLCPACLRYDLGLDPCPCNTPPVPRVPAAIPNLLNDNKRFTARCPACGAEDALTMLGSRAASLSSVAISQVFLSPFAAETERKMLAFTDSVQDASHRAGFFSGRTFRFNLRTGMQTCVERVDGDIPLPEVADRMMQLWEEEIGEPRMIATFLPPDLREFSEYKAYKEAKNPSKNIRERMRSSLNQRLSWEVTREYGMGVVVGRSLDRSGCSTLTLDETRLEEAANRLLLYLEEEKPVQSPLGAFELPEVRHFLEGLLQRMRLRGGIRHPLLDTYMKRGERFDLSKRRNPLMSPFGQHSVLPRFLYDGEQHRTFDALFANPSTPTWLRDWAIRSLRLPKTQEYGIHNVLEATVRYLEQAGVIGWQQCGKSRAAGIRMDALRVTRDVAQVHCRDCNVSHTLHRDAASRWENQKCTHYRCKGYFELHTIDSDPHDYYRTLHRSQRVRRVFAEEHTGMLERRVREDLEIRFKTGSTPDAPNLLTCTPTLEMGIDIGDLSTVMLCSVPPLSSNYLQRVGRAGRATGNALVLTLALARPHDQYFLTAPLEMMRGEITPPGCFLDAPEILLRQMTAHAMDQWAARQLRGDVIPKAMRYLSSKAERDGFPYSFYKFYEQNRDKVSERFFQAFGSQLTQANRERLELLVKENKVPTRIEGAFQSVREERKRLSARLKQLEERKEALEGNPSLAVIDDERPDQTVEEAAEEELSALEEAIRGYGRLLGNLLDKHPLNVLTDDGVLPNYAFPEPGVTLKAVLRSPRVNSKAKKKEQQPEPKQEEASKPSDFERMKFEYMRPASAALKEFAPFNTFYAEGHKMRITQIDVGSAAHKLIESWRFCPRCHYAVHLLGDEQAATACPRCNDEGFKDSGQVQQVVHFRCAWSSMDLADAVTVDDTEEREERSYKIGEIIDAGGAEQVGARLIESEDLLFGYELLRGLELKQLNFGQTGDTALPVRIAGEEISQQGFQLCSECGRVQDPFQRNATVQHAPYCKARLGKAPEELERVFLYRSLRSEAIRVLLPVSKHDLLRKRSSISAALQLGFRKMFGGQPTHLRITTASEPHGEDQLQFLVIYDTVPGGTGYLAELWKAGKFLELMQLSVDAMRTCSCASDPNRDGCYRCLFAYQDSWQLPNISRREAVDLFERILAHRPEEKEQPSLSNVSVLSVLESELEARFLEALKKRAIDLGWSWDQISFHGKTAWRLGARGTQWLIEPQVTLSSSDGVMVVSRPDFVIHCETRDGVRPIAVFCDGFRFHAQPDLPFSRIADDIWKRRAILDSGQFKVWSVTWRDVDQVLLADQPGAPTFWEKPYRALAERVFDIATVGKELQLCKAGSVELLVTYLGNPDQETWARRSFIGIMAHARATGGYDDETGASLEKELGTQPVRWDINAEHGTPKFWLSGMCSDLSWVKLLVRFPVHSIRDKIPGGFRVMLRLFDEHPARQDPDFEASWRAFLHAWNLLQFHYERVAVVSSEKLKLEGDAYASVLPSERPPPMQEQVAGDQVEALAKEVPEASALLRLISSKKLPMPRLDFSLASGATAVDVEAILAWPEQRVAVHYDATDADRARWKKHGFTLFALDTDTPESITAALGDSTSGVAAQSSVSPLQLADAALMKDQ